MSFKVGDEVIIIKETFSFDTVGDTMIISEVMDQVVKCRRPESNRPDYPWSYINNRVRKLTKLDRALK